MLALASFSPLLRVRPSWTGFSPLATARDLSCQDVAPCEIVTHPLPGFWQFVETLVLRPYMLCVFPWNASRPTSLIARLSGRCNECYRLV